MTIKKFSPMKTLIFDIKVIEACRSCKRYGLTGCCPPSIGSADYYEKLLKQYKYGKMFIEKFLIDDPKNYVEIGRTSSLELHKKLLKEREILLNSGHYFNVLLGGGSCKWCKECVIPCKSPQFRAIPIEATGINVVETMRKLGRYIKFPATKTFYRVGLVVWD